MAYDITAVIACAAVLAYFLRDGHFSRAEQYIMSFCCLVLGATSFITGMLTTVFFSNGINPYILAAIMLILIFWKKSPWKGNGYIAIACGLILGSSGLFMGWLPPLVNGAFDALGQWLDKGF